VESTKRTTTRPFLVKVLFSRGGRKEAVEATASFRTRNRATGLPSVTKARGDLPHALILALPFTGETDSRSVTDL
jgi:hypothetical protein